MADALPDEALVRARRRGKRVVLVSFISVATAFVLWSALEIIPQVFGIGIAPLEGAAPAARAPSSACAEGVRRLAASLDRATSRALAASGEPVATHDVEAADQEAAVGAFRASLSPEWDAEAQIGVACAAEPRGRDAFASVQRLRLANEQFVRHRVVEIAPLKRDVSAYLGAR